LIRGWRKFLLDWTKILTIMSKLITNAKTILSIIPEDNLDDDIFELFPSEIKAENKPFLDKLETFQIHSNDEIDNSLFISSESNINLWYKRLGDNCWVFKPVLIKRLIFHLGG